MTRFTNKAIVVGLLTGVLIAGTVQFSSVASAATSKPVASKKEVDSKSRPGVVFKTAGKKVELLFEEEDADYTADDFVPQARNTTKTYHLTKMKAGTTKKWIVASFDPKTAERLSYQTLRYNYYYRKVVKVDTGSCGVRSTETYVQIKPKKGGKMKVKSVQARVLTGGKAEWHNLRLALTDDMDDMKGTQVYSRDFGSGSRVTHLKTMSVYGKTVVATAGCLGD